MSSQLLAEAHRFLDWARQQGADLDGTDQSVWFVQGALESMAQDADEEQALRVVKCLAYSVYLAELLADTCNGVRCVVEGEGMNLRGVLAVGEGKTVQYTLSWVLSCLNDPVADNIGFKFAGALRDFDEERRASDNAGHCGRGTTPSLIPRRLRATVEPAVTSHDVTNPHAAQGRPRSVPPTPPHRHDSYSFEPSGCPRTHAA